MSELVKYGLKHELHLFNCKLLITDKEIEGHALFSFRISRLN